MQVIPVIDIREGAVVRAIAGRRSDYRPIASSLAPTSAPLDVARGLMSLFPFRALYVADLDAIEGRAPNRDAIAAISAAYPALDLWVDAGLRRGAELEAALVAGNVSVVVGSESFTDLAALAAMRDSRRTVLSLDFAGARFLGAPELQTRPELWPPRVIVMTLARVGGDCGPDLVRLAEIVSLSEKRAVYAAGGVRNASDLETLGRRGAAGALVASALHAGRLTAAELARFSAKK